MLRRGVIVWLLIGAAFVGLEAAGLTEGLTLPVPLIVALVLARALEHAEWARRHPRLVAAGVGAVCAALALVAGELGLQAADLSPRELTAVLLAAAGLAVLLSPAPVRAALLRPLGLDPGSPVHAVTAVAFALVLGSSVVLFVQLQGEPSVSIPFYLSDSVVSIVSDVALALAGVGAFLTRGAAATLARLDLRPLRLRHLGWALGIAVLFHVGVTVMEWTEGVVLPDLHALEDRFDYEFIGIPPLVGAALVSLAAGVGEEILFRGALQPRLGVVLTAALFASLHVQYQLPGILMIFGVGLGLGLLKQRTSTTFTAVVHVIYDLGAFLTDLYGG
ncbi:MAG: hypothetical protein AUH29_06335 [Candidatus Rokubacteria bacterium 13_1_40CM_69_27]|nr:MAG: hypothetical protein AUH29_06335 [Candidatus Rokubacteria bacterium 13_1_40CM_69_27]OLC37450.1 MAG: hypothetical protein AUH81_06010 [Candidatus Rokubacteria bacterium 13_1_40CM_4_69_5]